ncbi:MAG: hypothetical protein HFH62_02110 [Lachnospiraceae bacterium]|nr:hypothetical protein [Lachnospiraceae bacterium]
MEYENNHQRQMAILEAAMPYVAPESRHAIQMLLQTESLLQLARQGGNSDYALEAAENNQSGQPNIKEMLLHIQEYLTPRESDLVQTILNFMNAGSLFQSYREFAQMHSRETPAQNNIMRDFLMSQLNPEQKATFEQMQNFMYND